MTNFKHFTDEEFDRMFDSEHADEAKGASIRMYLDKGYSYEQSVRFAENPDAEKDFKDKCMNLFGFPGMF